MAPVQSRALLSCTAMLAMLGTALPLGHNSNPYSDPHVLCNYRIFTSLPKIPQTFIVAKTSEAYRSGDFGPILGYQTTFTMGSHLLLRVKPVERFFLRALRKRGWSLKPLRVRDLLLFTKHRSTVLVNTQALPENFTITIDCHL